MQKVCKIKFPMQWAEGNLIKFQSKLLKNNKDIFEEKVEADMVLAFSTMKVSVVISFQMDKQINGREEKVHTHAFMHMQM